MQHDFNIANQGFPATRSDINNALAALASTSSGASEPSTTYANQFWYDTTNNLLKFRNEADSAWITLAYLDQATNEWEIRSAVIQAVDSAGISLKTDDGTARVVIQDDGDVAFDTDTLFVDAANDRVGIGTSSPDRTLHVTRGDGTGTVVKVENTGTSSSTIEFTNTGSTDTISIGAENNDLVLKSDDGDISLNTTGDPATASLYVERGGNVGIGESSLTGNALEVRRSGKAGVVFKETGVAQFYVEQDTDAKIRVTNSKNLIFSGGANGTTERMRIDSSGCLLVNTTSKLIGGETAKFSSTGSGSNTLVLTHDSTDDRGILVTLHSGSSGGTSRTHAAFLSGGGFEVGSIKANGSSTSYNTSSDYRLKENVTDVTDGIKRVKQLNPRRFNFIADPDTTVDGFIAHEAQAVVPEAITGAKDAMRDEEYEVTAALGEVYTPAAEATFDDDGNELTAAADEVIHSTDVAKPETLADGQFWRETTPAVMGTRSVPDYQGIDQSKLVPLLTAALQEAIAKIEDLETRVAALESA